MLSADLALTRIEAITEEIAALQRALGFPANQPSDREAHDLAARLERQMLSRRQETAA